MMWLLSILYFISIMVLSRSFVITKYGPEDLTEYFHKIRDYSNRKGIVNDSSADDFFAGLDLFEYCHQLRQSGIFMVVNEAVDVRYVYYTDYFLPKQELETEKETIDIEKLNLRVMNLGNQFQMKLNAFRCLDFEGAPRVIITPGYIPQSAFIFAYEQNFRNIETRNLRRSKEVPVNLAGVIDDLGIIVPESYLRILDVLMGAASKSEESKLCNLHPIIKYRLCAIVGDTLRRHYKNEEITSMDNNVTTQNYKSLSVDSYYLVELPDSNNTSSGRQVKKNWSFTTRGMLNCPITIPNFMYDSSLYLRENVGNPTRVLIIWYSETRAAIKAHVIDVPLLKHVQKYQEALTNDDD